MITPDAGSKAQAFYYGGSRTHPTCDETVHWYVHGSLFPISRSTAEQIQNTYLSNEDLFKNKQNSRSIKINPIPFYMVDLTYDAIKG